MVRKYCWHCVGTRQMDRRGRSQENFIPFLMTNDGKRIDLVSFYGAEPCAPVGGEFILGDQIIDFKGRQEKRAREFTERVAASIGVPVGIDPKITADTRSIVAKVKCTSCGHCNVSSYKSVSTEEQSSQLSNIGEPYWRQTPPDARNR